MAWQTGLAAAAAAAACQCHRVALLLCGSRLLPLPLLLVPPTALLGPAWFVAAAAAGGAGLRAGPGNRSLPVQQHWAEGRCLGLRTALRVAAAAHNDVPLLPELVLLLLLMDLVLLLLRMELVLLLLLRSLEQHLA